MSEVTPMNEKPNHDDELSTLLQSWRVTPEDDPALARNVWARIEAAPVSPLQLWLENLNRVFRQPAMVAAAFAVFAAAGALTAELHYSGHREARLDRLATEYVLTIDPVRMTGHAGASDPHP
jgi:hypothetical protein